jgi:hypothetical protein
MGPAAEPNVVCGGDGFAPVGLILEVPLSSYRPGLAKLGQDCGCAA